MSDKSSIYCPSCSQRTSIEKRVSWNGQGFIYQIGECNSCSQCFLVKRDSTNNIIELFPNALAKPVADSIPSPIRDDLQEAYKCISVQAWRASVTMARRALQNICLEKGAPITRTVKAKGGKSKEIKNDLINQINWLYDERIITKDLKDWAHEIRVVGNMGAHPGEAEDTEPVSSQDADDILNLVEAFCGPLYIAASVYSTRKLATTQQ